MRAWQGVGLRNNAVAKGSALVRQCTLIMDHFKAWCLWQRAKRAQFYLACSVAAAPLLAPDLVMLMSYARDIRNKWFPIKPDQGRKPRGIQSEFKKRRRKISIFGVYCGWRRCRYSDSSSSNSLESLTTFRLFLPLSTTTKLPSAMRSLMN